MSKQDTLLLLPPCTHTGLRVFIKRKKSIGPLCLQYRWNLLFFKVNVDKNI